MTNEAINFVEEGLSLLKVKRLLPFEQQSFSSRIFTNIPV